MSFGFARGARITHSAELQRIAQEGKRIRTAHFEVRATASPLTCLRGRCTRVGLIIPKFRHTAVARNLVKRRLRELSRVRLIPSDIAADLVIRIRPEAYRATFAQLASDIERALGQLTRWRATVVDLEAPSGGNPLELPVE